MRTSETLWGVLLVSLACTGGQASGPPIAECERGLFFADCGGNEEPVLACSSSKDDCRWFSGGNVAREYDRRSDCPSSDVCCHDNFPLECDVDGLGPQLRAYGTLPWDGERSMDVSVNYADAVEWTPFNCGSAPFMEGTPCHHVNISDSGMLIRGDYFAFDTYGFSSLGGWYPVIEVDPSGTTARVCSRWYSDSVSPGGRGRCVPDKNFCALSGTLTLTGIPELGQEPIQGYLDVDFGEFSLRGSFSYMYESEPP